MKTETTLKILKRYSKNLKYLEDEANRDGLIGAKGQYQVDRNAMEQAIKLIEERENA